MPWSLQFLGYLRTLSLKFQKARTKIEVFLFLPCWLSRFSCNFLTSGMLILGDVSCSGFNQYLKFGLCWAFHCGYCNYRLIVFRKSLFNHFIKESKQKFYMTVQGVLALCKFHYWDFSKKSINLPNANFGQFYTISAIFGAKIAKKS